MKLTDDKREAAYDAEINPLMAQIIEICKREKIAMLCNFLIGHDDDGSHYCTTALLGDDYRPTPAQIEALRCVRNPARDFAAFTITSKPIGRTAP